MPAKGKTLLLCVPAGWETYISREFHELQQGLVALGWVMLIIDNATDEEIIRAIARADVVLLWEAYELLERNKDSLCKPRSTRPGCKRLFFCDDVHFFTTARRNQRARAFLWADTIFATYPDKLGEWYPEIALEKIRWMPHCAAAAFQATFTPACDRILLSGSRTWPYPFRQFCHAKLPESLCHVIDHPGYPGYPGDRNNRMQANPAAMNLVGGEHYATILQRYPAMLVCGSVFGYLVAKVFEAMAAGCLVMCERTSLASRLTALGFIEGVHYLATDLMHVAEDAEALHDMYLHRDTQWLRIVHAANKKVVACHTVSVRTRQIHNHSLTG